MNYEQLPSEEVTDVLLADGWHPVFDHSFELVDYSWGKENRWPGACWVTTGQRRISCPLTSIVAIKEDVSDFYEPDGTVAGAEQARNK